MVCPGFCQCCKRNCRCQISQHSFVQCSSTHPSWHTTKRRTLNITHDQNDEILTISHHTTLNVHNYKVQPCATRIIHSVRCKPDNKRKYPLLMHMSKLAGDILLFGLHYAAAALATIDKKKRLGTSRAGGGGRKGGSYNS